MAAEVTLSGLLAVVAAIAVAVVLCTTLRLHLHRFARAFAPTICEPHSSLSRFLSNERGAYANRDRRPFVLEWDQIVGEISSPINIFVVITKYKKKNNYNHLHTAAYARSISFFFISRATVSANGSTSQNKVMVLGCSLEFSVAINPYASNFT